MARIRGACLRKNARDPGPRPLRRVRARLPPDDVPDRRRDRARRGLPDRGPAARRPAAHAALILTHAHFDHIASLPFLVDNLYGQRRPLEVIAPAPVLATLSADIFNDATWPDFTRLPSRGAADACACARSRKEALPGGERDRHALRRRPRGARLRVPRRQARPLGALLRRHAADRRALGGGAARAEPEGDLPRGFFLGRAGGKWPAPPATSRRASSREELAKAPPRVPVYLYHMKPPSLSRIRREIAALREPRLRLLESERSLSASEQCAGPGPGPSRARDPGPGPQTTLRSRAQARRSTASVPAKRPRSESLRSRSSRGARRGRAAARERSCLPRSSDLVEGLPAPPASREGVRRRPVRRDLSSTPPPAIASPAARRRERSASLRPPSPPPRRARPPPSAPR